MRLLVFVAALCLSAPVWADRWNYDGPIRVIGPGEKNRGVTITESEHKERLAEHEVVKGHLKIQSKNTTRFPMWFSR